MSPRVVVVGGGVIGAACAYYLREAGRDVTLVDKGEVGQGCSHGNCGYVCPSHVLPLAGPGVLGRTLWTLLQRESPLKIRFRLDLSLWVWLIRFALRCNRRAMMETAHALQPLLNSSRGLYDELFRSGKLDAEWEERGTLLVFRSHEGMEHHAHTDRLLREHFDMPATRYDGPALTELEPALKPGLAGGWHYPRDAHLRPDKLMASWRQLLLARGVEIREHHPLVGFERAGREVRAVVVGKDTIPAEAVVIATGAWTPLLKEQLGVRLPIQPGKGYSITTTRPSRCPKIPLLFEEDRVAITPMQTGYRIGSTMEFAGYDDSLNRRRLELLRRGARLYLDEPEGETVQEEWWGWRPMVADGKPIIGRLPRWENVVAAAGHGMIGVATAPGTGKLVSALLTGRTPHLDPTPFAATRF
jgi:D-amino-acid dehydrogenase